MEAYIKSVEDIINFCSQHEFLYIYGSGKMAQLIYQYLNACSIEIKGFVVTDNSNKSKNLCKVPIYMPCEISSLSNSGFILGLSDRHYNDVISTLRQYEFNNYFILSAHDKDAIYSKMTIPIRETCNFEISVLDHCNLSCAYCDHFSNISKKNKFLSILNFTKDIERMSELFGMHSGEISLMGGEPLLHPQIENFFILTRKYFPFSKIICLTNGIKLLSKDEDFWRIAAENKITIRLTPYPVNIDVAKIHNKASTYGVDFIIIANNYDNSVDKYMGKFPLCLSGNCKRAFFLSCCYFNNCRALRNGKFFSCHIISNIHIFNHAFQQDLQVTDEDYVDIYKVQNFEELAMAMVKPPAFCRYCDVKNRRLIGPWQPSTRKIGEYID